MAESLLLIMRPVEGDGHKLSGTKDSVCFRPPKERTCGCLQLCTLKPVHSHAAVLTHTKRGELPAGLCFLHPQELEGWPEGEAARDQG